MEKYPKYSKRFKIKCFDLTCEFVIMIFAVDADEDVFLQLICFHLYIECLKLTLNITLNDLINQMQNHQSYSVTLC